MSSQTVFTPGNLVSVRGREWVVLPTPIEWANEPDLIYVKPLDGSDAEATGILTSVENPQPARFAPPNPELVGSDRSCRFMRDALRFSIRNGAGPFRSFARYAFEPRPYQFTPLLLALRQKTPRLLLADDVGIGKTIETGMIVRELVDRGEIRRFCILCPPCLAEQWRRELYEKFQIDAALVLPNTVAKLERQCAPGESLFKVYPYTIASIDFMKTNSRRNEFVKSAPDLIVFDEAHAVANDLETNAKRQRYSLARDLCADPERAVVLVTATPHSGKDSAFRSLLTLLDPKFADENLYPNDMSGKEHERERRELAKYFIQRRRADVKEFLDNSTPFPECVAKDQEWSLSPKYAELFDRALDYVDALVRNASKDARDQRVRWWTALSLMRSLSSSPAAAVATLNQRSRLAPEDDGEFESLDVINERGRIATLDADANEVEFVSDAALGVDLAKKQDREARKELAELAKLAQEIRGVKNDPKLQKLLETVKSLLKDGFRPIVFCRFIPTVDYVAEELRKNLPSDVAIERVSGELPPEERERRVMALEDSEKRVLVCSDCLSEGVNLQELFDAVVHYDLSWNPTRHEQREGRVDRFGQTRRQVRSVTFYCKDNGIDGLVLEILLKKHRAIKKSLGVSVALPTELNALMEAIFNGFRMRRRRTTRESKTLYFPEFEASINEDLRQSAEEYAAKLNEVARAEASERGFLGDLDEELAASAKAAGFVSKDQKLSQTVYAHVATSREASPLQLALAETRRACGNSGDLKSFLLNGLVAAGGKVDEKRKDGVVVVELDKAAVELRDYLPNYDRWNLAFEEPVPSDAEYVSRVHPLATGLADYLLNASLDSTAVDPIARRCGVMRTDAVKEQTTLLLVRRRFTIKSTRKSGEVFTSLAEDVAIVPFEGVPESPRFLDDPEAGERLLDARPSGNAGNEDSVKRRVKRVCDAYEEKLKPRLVELGQSAADALKTSHERVRNALRNDRKIEVEPEAEPDLVGVYVLIPNAT